MKLLNYDFYDLYALLIFFRMETDKISEYAEAVEEIVAYRLLRWLSTAGHPDRECRCRSHSGEWQSQYASPPYPNR